MNSLALYGVALVLTHIGGEPYAVRRSDFPTYRQYLYSLHWSEVLLREAIAEKVNVPETFTPEEKVAFLVSQGVCRTDVSLQLDPPSCRCDLHLRCFPVGTRLWLGTMATR